MPEHGVQRPVAQLANPGTFGTPQHEARWKPPQEVSMAQALQELAAAGVAVWLDDLSRPRIQSGSLARLVEQGDIVGITTNPTIFAKAIGAGSGYEEQLRDLALRGTAIGETLRLLTGWDVRAACDVLRPVFDRTGGRDGRVSIEVDPRIAQDAERTTAEARGLWWLVDRPNLFIKIPATVAGLPAITACLAEGISVNVTLIFSVERYQAVLDAYMAGLERRAANGASLRGIESVASFFVSRVDTEVDRRISETVTHGSFIRRRWCPRGGRRWQRQALDRNVCSGRLPVSKTKRSRTRATSLSWSRWTQSTRCRKPRCRPLPTMGKCVATQFRAATQQLVRF
jgi:transaldolase